MEFITDSQMVIIRNLATELFSNIGQAHGNDHMFRVEQMALQFGGSSRNPNLVSTIALLHDVDDYKLFPASGNEQPNAHKILLHAGLQDDAIKQALHEISQIGYSKRLSGGKPTTPEGMAVSDADMCDAMGATGIVRIIEYDLARGLPIFDRDDFPNTRITASSYTTYQCGMVRHMFEKILLLPDMMLTKEGRTEALRRKEITVMFLHELFREQNAPEWSKLLAPFERKLHYAESY